MEKPHFSDDFIEDIMINIFGFCPCGAPYIFVNQLYEYLKIVEAGTLPDDKYIAYEYLADRAGLTEHGGSVLGAWLSEDGKRLLKLMEENK